MRSSEHGRSASPTSAAFRPTATAGPGARGSRRGPLQYPHAGDTWIVHRRRDRALGAVREEPDQRFPAAGGDLHTGGHRRPAYLAAGGDTAAAGSHAAAAPNAATARGRGDLSPG